MLTLEDIDLRLYRYRNSLCHNTSPEIFALLHYGVVNCQQLSEYIESGNSSFQKKKLYHILKNAERTVERLNTQGITPIYYKEDYGDFSQFKPLFDRTDRGINCSALPFYAPASSHEYAFRLRNFNIEAAKLLLSKVGLTGQNAFCEVANSFGPSKAQRLGWLMSFYDEQLIRVAKSLDDPETFKENLFSKNREKKQELVSSMYEDIVLYLLEQGSFISKVTPSALSRSLQPVNENDRYVRHRVIEIISDYCTLEELENLGSVKDETLKRFVMEPKKETRR